MMPNQMEGALFQQNNKEYCRKTISQIAFKIVDYEYSFKDVLILCFEEPSQAKHPIQQNGCTILYLHDKQTKFSMMPSTDSLIDKG
jgi:hypothetical protein